MIFPLLTPGEYDPRYLAGILFFNRGDYFEAHEVWEDLWQNCDAADRRFFQGLIQASVALYHAMKGNRVGASRLFGSAKRYLELYPLAYHGLQRKGLFDTLERSLTLFLRGEQEQFTPEPGVYPQIELDPQPSQWPDPVAVLHATEEQSEP